MLGQSNGQQSADTSPEKQHPPSRVAQLIETTGANCKVQKASSDERKRRVRLMQGLRVHIYRYLTVVEAKTKIARLSRRERQVQLDMMRYLRRGMALRIDTWSSSNEAYKINNRPGQCLAHDDRLASFKTEAIRQADSIVVMFNISTWRRCHEHMPADEHFGAEPAKYLAALKENIQQEEKAYEQTSRLVFDAISITQECFEKTQQKLMSDPYVSMELYNLGISMEQPSASVPTDLTVERTVELVKSSNDYAFDLFKREYASQVTADPMLMPVLISAIAHDWVKVNHNIDEDNFKAALFKHKIYENPEVSEHMQQKQMELMMMAMQQNPQMMQGMGGPMGPGGMPF